MLAVADDLLFAPFIDAEVESVLSELVPGVEPEVLPVAADVDDPVVAVPVPVASASSVELGTLKTKEPMSSVIRRRTASEIWALSILSLPAVSYRQCSEIAE